MTQSRFSLQGKVALVTGGNGGIGLGIAEALAEAGADICIWGRNEEKNKEAERRLRLYGRRVLALKCDVSDDRQVEECYAKTVQTLGRVDSCFANAGIGIAGTAFHEMTTAEWRQMIANNLDSVFFTLREAVRDMLKRGEGGSIVVTSSLASMSGLPRGEHYAAAKAGMLAMIRGLAVEYARNGIRANAIVPGWIQTEMASESPNFEKIQEKAIPRIPLRRWGLPSDLGGIAVYFASDASVYHTGDVVIVDGGYICF